MNKKEETIATYNATAPEMAKKFRGIGARIADIERGLALVGKENPNTLEIGCGDGRDAKEIVKRTDKYTGIDASSSMIDIARKYVPEGTFQVADIEEYVFPPRLDLVFAFASLLHADKENVRNILGRMRASLHTGGIAYISLKCGEYHEETRTDEFGTRTYYFYTPQLIKELAGESYSVVFEETMELRGQKWLTIVLRKAQPMSIF